MKKILVGIVVALALFGLSIFIASEGGEEIVTLRTTDEDGSTVETRLWVVDDAGSAWLRAGVASSKWLARLERQPEVELERGGSSTRVRAVVVREPAVRDRVHALMREKYGLADRWISLTRSGEQSLAVSLEPLP